MSTIDYKTHWLDSVSLWVVRNRWQPLRKAKGSLFFGNLVNLVVLDTQVPSIEKSHSSPGTSKPSPSEGQSQSHSHGHSQHSRSHGASRSSKSAARQHHQESLNGSRGGAAVATGDAQQQSQQQPPQRLQPSKPRRKWSLRSMASSHSSVLPFVEFFFFPVPLFPFPYLVSPHSSHSLVLFSIVSTVCQPFMASLLYVFTSVSSQHLTCKVAHCLWPLLILTSFQICIMLANKYPVLTI